MRICVYATEPKKSQPYCTFISEDASGACIMCQKAHPKRRLIVAEEAVAARGLIVAEEAVAAAEAEPEAAAVAFVRPSCVVVLTP